MNYLKRKYMTLMRGVNFQGYLQKASGNPLMLTDCISNSPMWLSVFGNSIQDGTPTLDNPIEIQSVGDLVTDETSEYYGKYDIPIVVRGKNLIKYPYATASRTMNGIRYTVNKDGSVSVVGTATAASYFILNSNVDYGNSSIPENSTNGVYATSEGVKYNVGNHTVSINVASGETVDKIVYPQIEYGTTATEYEPYQGSETIHIYLDAPLRKVGNYADYIDFKNKRVVRNIVKRSLGVESIYRKLNNVIRFSFGDIPGKLDYHMLSTIFRNYSGFGHDAETVFHHPTSPYAFYWSVRWHRLGLTYDGTNVYRTDDIEKTPLTDNQIINIAKEWLKTLSNEDKEVFIILEKPTETTISLPILKAFEGTNIISVDTSVIPSNMECEYYSTTKQEEE